VRRQRGPDTIGHGDRHPHANRHGYAHPDLHANAHHHRYADGYRDGDFQAAHPDAHAAVRVR
jgi:hypothetical protein